MTKAIIKSRAEYAKGFGQAHRYDGIIADAESVLAMCRSRKHSAESIITTEAYRTVLRVYYR